MIKKTIAILRRLWIPKYTIAEIDKLRSLVARKNQEYHGIGDREIEDQLRTYMMNGTTIQELSDEVDRLTSEYYRQQDESKKKQLEERAKFFASMGDGGKFYVSTEEFLADL